MQGVDRKVGEDLHQLRRVAEHAASRAGSPASSILSVPLACFGNDQADHLAEDLDDVDDIAGRRLGPCEVEDLAAHLGHALDLRE